MDFGNSTFQSFDSSTSRNQISTMIRGLVDASFLCCCKTNFLISHLSGGITEPGDKEAKEITLCSVVLCMSFSEFLAESWDAALAICWMWREQGVRRRKVAMNFSSQYIVFLNYWYNFLWKNNLFYHHDCQVYPLLALSPF